MTVLRPAPAALSKRRPAAGVKAEQAHPKGPGLDAGEDRRTLDRREQAKINLTRITRIMPMSAHWMR